MTRAALIEEHLREETFLLASLTREKLRGGPLVPQIQAARFFKRVKTSLRLQTLTIEVALAETRTALGVLDAKVAALARAE